MENRDCIVCKRDVPAPRGIKYILKSGKVEIYCKRRCFVFKNNKLHTSKKITHLSRLRTKKAIFKLKKIK